MAVVCDGSLAAWPCAFIVCTTYCAVGSSCATAAASRTNVLVNPPSTIEAVCTHCVPRYCDASVVEEVPSVASET